MRLSILLKNFEAARDFGHVREGYRFSKVKSHLIFFKRSQGGVVEVIRVLHENIDIVNRL